MNGLVNGRRLIATALGVALTAATLMIVAGTSQAYGGHGYRGGYGYRGGARVYVNHVGRGGGHYYGGARFYRGPRAYHGGARYIYRPSYGYYPRAYVGFGLGFAFGAPYHYYPRPYPSHVYHHYVPEPEQESQPQVKPEPQPAPEAEPEIDVENEPPSGCYYYDRTCDREFKTLDDYTDHLDDFTSKDHPQTLRVMSKDTHETIRVLEFVDGYWSVKKSRTL